jgi:hypothetical protein
MTTVPNGPTLEQFELDLIELAKLGGKSKDNQIKFDLKVFDAAYHGKLNLQPDKHGVGIDDAQHYAELYVKHSNPEMQFCAKADNQRKLSSTIRTAIKIGGYTKGGVNEPLATCNNLMNTRLDLKKKGTKGLEDAHNMFLNWARAQLKANTMIDGDQLKQFCFKPAADIRTVEEVLRSIQKIASNLKVGKVTNCPDVDASPEVQSIINSCNQRLVKLIQARTSRKPTP